MNAPKPKADGTDRALREICPLGGQNPKQQARLAKAKRRSAKPKDGFGMGAFFRGIQSQGFIAWKGRG
ncbi:MAG: hypothetical protein OHK0053_34870 [Microscillaceae bacterium]